MYAKNLVQYNFLMNNGDLQQVSTNDYSKEENDQYDLTERR